MTDHDLEQLSDLARRTDDVRPSPSFADAVMSAVEAEASAVPSSPLSEELSRTGVVAIGIAAVAAAAALILSVDAQQRFDEEVLVSVDVVEVAE